MLVSAPEHVTLASLALQYLPRCLYIPPTWYPYTQKKSWSCT